MNVNSQTISILGCGWLGLPLAEDLIKKGFTVKGASTSAEKLLLLKQKNILPFKIEVTDTGIVADHLDDFLNAAVLIINFPPKRRPDIETYYKAQLEVLIARLEKSPIKHVLFVSSTSVYPDVNREVFEDETALPSKASGRALILAETLLCSQTNFSTTVIRFSGLIGYDRMPGRFLAGKKNVENGDAPINVIHRDDCIQLLTQLLQKNRWGQIFNASADKHPERKLFYTLAASQLGLDPPTFAIGAHNNFKIINSDKIKKYLGYQFKYPDPLQLIEMQNE